MAIRKRTWGSGKGRREAWVVDYFDQGGTRRLKTFSTKREATDWWTTQGAAEVKKGIHTADSASKTVAEAGKDWVDGAERDGLEAATVMQYRQHRDLHILPFLGGEKLSRLTSPGVREFEDKLRKGLSEDAAARHVAGLLKSADKKPSERDRRRMVAAVQKPRSPAMVRKVVSSLGALIADAQERGYVARNVVREKTRKRRGKAATRHRKRLEVGVDLPSMEELRAMLAVLSNADGQGDVPAHHRALILTLVFTGLRASEMRGLRWADVDLEAKAVHVRQRADRFNEIGSPKSDTSKRDIPLAPMAANALKAWKLESPAGDLVFGNGRGNVENLGNIRRRILGSVQKRAGLCEDADRPKYGLHAFRHAAASMFIDQGFKPKRVQALMGHSSIQITFDIYGHLFPADDDDAKAMEMIQARLAG